MEKNNLIILANAFWNYGKGMSGSDQIVKQVISRIWDNFETVYTLTNNEGQKLFSKVPNAIHIKHNKLTESSPLELAYILRTLFGIFKIIRIKSNIIYSDSDFFPDVIPAFIYKLLHPSVIWHQPVFHIYPHWSTRPGNKIVAILGYYNQKISHTLAKRADNIICINTQVEKVLISRGLKKEKISLIYPGVNYESIVNTLPSGENYSATFLARLQPSKGIFDLIEIWGRVVEIDPSARLAVIGGGPKEIVEELHQTIKAKKLENNVVVKGYLEDDLAYGLIKSSKVFIFPSHEEGFGIAIAEAMTCGTPVIAWDLPVYNEVFEDKIITVPEREFSQFATNIIGVINDPQLRNKMSEDGKKYIGRYSWDNVANQYLTCLTKH